MQKHNFFQTPKPKTLLKPQYKEVQFKNHHIDGSHFDIVQFEDLLSFTPKDHNQFEFHRVAFYVILLGTKNEGAYNLNFKEYTLNKGSLFTLRKDHVHKFYKSDAEGVLLLFTEKFIMNHSNQLDASKVFLMFNENLFDSKIQLSDEEYSEIITLIDLTKKEYFNDHDEWSQDLVRTLMQTILTKLFRIKSQDNNNLKKSKYLSSFLTFQELVEKNGFQSRQVAYYSERMGISAKTLNNVTQDMVSKSAKAFINDIVILQSKRMIIDSPSTLSEIATRLGFYETTNFFKYFKKYTGQSPNEFRESVLES